MNANVKKYGTIAAVSLLTVLVVNTLAKRFEPIAKVKSTVESGL